MTCNFTNFDYICEYQWRSGGIGRHAGLNASRNAKSNPVSSNVRVGSIPIFATKYNYDERIRIS